VEAIRTKLGTWTLHVLLPQRVTEVGLQPMVGENVYVLSVAHAEIVAVPAATPVTRPLCVELSTVAIEVLLEAQVAPEVASK